jgi:serine protease Do
MRWRVVVLLAGLAGVACTITPPKEPAPGDESLVPPDDPVFEQRLEGLKREDLDLSRFFSELPASARREHIPLHHLTFADVAARAKPGVVNIYTRKVVERDLEIGFDLSDLLPIRLPIVSSLLEFIPFQVPVPFRGEGFALGSGFVVNREGYVLTNAHVIRNATDVQVVFSDGRETAAKIVGVDPVTDTALVQVAAGPHLVPLPLGDSGALEVGELVVAVGNPLGLSHSVTSGLVSATERTIPSMTELLDFLQTDSAINPGNSGGPLLNLHGEVVGMNTAIVTDAQLIGFAIPIDTVKSILPLLLLRDSERGYLGVSVAPGTPADQTPVIDLVESGGPAEALGLQVGDRIVEVNSQPITGIVPLRRLALGLLAGDELRMAVVRGGKRHDFDTVLGARPR